MKKLTLKDGVAAPKERVTKAKSILDIARNQLKEFAHQEIQLLYNAIFGNNPNFADDEEWCVQTGDLPDDIYINVFCYDKASTNQQIFDRIEVAEVIAALDGSVILRNEDGDEWTSEEISVEDFANVCDVLQFGYMSRVNGTFTR